MRDAQGRPVGPFDLWQGTMMANATRDPFFRAVFSAELAATPAAAAAIERKCLTCHAPMAATEATASGASLGLADLYRDSPRGQLALDAVSCTSCHQLDPEGMGTAASFSGGYVIRDQGVIYGPHEAPFTRPMQMHTGYTPVASTHLGESAACASCHTLFTDPLDEQGQALGGAFPEQTPFLEWRNSVYAEGPEAQTCQDCHLPTRDEDGAPIETRIARNPGGRDFAPIGVRAPYGRHLMVGGNTLVLSMLRDQAERLGPSAAPAAFDEAIKETRRQLSENTAELVVGPPRTVGDHLELQVTVRNQTGHKLPTGYPSRRVWLSAALRDAGGAVLFESGRSDDQGRLLGADGQVRPEEHAGGPLFGPVDRVEGGGGPAVWESLMADATGRPTFTLLRAGRYLKDNRILPKGWRPGHLDAAATAPVGTVGDPNFVGGQDAVTLVLPIPAAGATLSLRLLYQPISPRWVEELALHPTAEVQAFLEYWNAADRRPESLATASVSL